MDKRQNRLTDNAQYMFMVPLYFQAVRGDSPAEAGLRLMIPAMATPVGGVIAGALMHRGYRLSLNVQMGTAMMLLGNVLALTMGTTGARWKEFFYLVPANMGLGLTNPSVLFSFVSLFEHRGKSPALRRPGKMGKQKLTLCFRASRRYFNRLPDPIHGKHLWCYRHSRHCAECFDGKAGRDFGRCCHRRGSFQRFPNPADPVGKVADNRAGQLVERLRKSVFALQELSPELQTAIRELYGDALRIAFAASSGFALMAFIFSWAHKTGSLRRKS